MRICGAFLACLLLMLRARRGNKVTSLTIAKTHLLALPDQIRNFSYKHLFLLAARTARTGDSRFGNHGPTGRGAKLAKAGTYLVLVLKRPCISGRPNSADCISNVAGGAAGRSARALPYFDVDCRKSRCEAHSETTSGRVEERLFQKKALGRAEREMNSSGPRDHRQLSFIVGDHNYLWSLEPVGPSSQIDGGC